MWQCLWQVKAQHPTEWIFKAIPVSADVVTLLSFWQSVQQARDPEFNEEEFVAWKEATTHRVINDITGELSQLTNLRQIKAYQKTVRQSFGWFYGSFLEHSFLQASTRMIQKEISQAFGRLLDQHNKKVLIGGIQECERECQEESAEAFSSALTHELTKLLGSKESEERLIGIWQILLENFYTPWIESNETTLFDLITDTLLEKDILSTYEGLFDSWLSLKLSDWINAFDPSREGPTTRIELEGGAVLSLPTQPREGLVRVLFNCNLLFFQNNIIQRVKTNQTYSFQAPNYQRIGFIKRSTESSTPQVPWIPISI